MVLKKRLDYSFDGYQTPFIPRAPRSARRRGPRRKSADDICAFELLAAVAGKLLQESESSASSNAEGGKDRTGTQKDTLQQERFEDTKALKSECFDQGSCIESAFLPVLAVREREFKPSSVGAQHAENESVLEHASIITGPDLSLKLGCNVNLEINEEKATDKNLSINVEGDKSRSGNLCKGKIEIGTARVDDRKQIADLTATNNCSLKDPIGKFVNNNALINSESSVQLPSYREIIPMTSFPKHRNDVKLGSRDNDENSFRCNKGSTKVKGFRRQPRIGYRRIRKMLTSKYWKVAPRLKDCEFSNSYEGIKPLYCNRKSFYARKSCEREIPPKRRKLFGHSFEVTYDQEASSESISNSPDKGLKGDRSKSDAAVQKGNGGASSAKSHQTSKDPSVKFSIKSFRVPELYIEVPETATVGSLKRTVMEAVTAILGGGLRVGVVCQGKKVREDNRTLQQAGISHGGNLDTLGFILEPNFAQVSQPVSPKDPPLLLTCDADQQLSRSPASPIWNSGFSNASVDPPRVTKLDKHVETNLELVPSPRTPTAPLTDGEGPDSKALVALPARSVEALAVVPVNQKSKRSELSQRRTRRPFSVAEVEALVEAVEKLGTGRWRDVKMRAFEHADHRTYVDLKDKWKTLVHTASISPQQRRGEPVPQELLDRVLSAHAYWSQHQSKQHGKHQIEYMDITEPLVDRIGA